MPLNVPRINAPLFLVAIVHSRLCTVRPAFTYCYWRVCVRVKQLVSLHHDDDDGDNGRQPNDVYPLCVSKAGQLKLFTMLMFV